MARPQGHARRREAERAQIKCASSRFIWKSVTAARAGAGASQSRAGRLTLHITHKQCVDLNNAN